MNNLKNLKATYHKSIIAFCFLVLLSIISFYRLHPATTLICMGCLISVAINADKLLKAIRKDKKKRILTYVTFGWGHCHVINGKTFDKNCVALIECENEEHGRALAFEIFEGVFCFEYHEDKFDIDSMEWYPRGFIPANY